MTTKNRLVTTGEAVDSKEGQRQGKVGRAPWLASFMRKKPLQATSEPSEVYPQGIPRGGDESLKRMDQGFQPRLMDKRWKLDASVAKSVRMYAASRSIGPERSAWTRRNGCNAQDHKTHSEL